MTQSNLREYAFAFQPILDRSHSTIGIELLYREELQLGSPPDDTFMSSSVIISAFVHSSGDAAHCRHTLFFKIGEVMLMNELLGFLPRKNIVLELPATIKPTEAILARCRELKNQGYRIALDNVASLDGDVTSLLEVADIVKIDLHQVSKNNLQDLVNRLKFWPAKLLAGKVETGADAETCTRLGFHMFQGYFFARPTLVTGRRPDPAKLTVLNLLAELIADAHDRVIEKVFWENPGLVYHLLRLANSAAFGMSTKIGSIRQALNLIGRNQLIRWIQMLLFSLDDGATIPSALMELATRRGKFMELMAQHASHELGTFQDRSHMAGILSLADTLLGMPMEEIVRILNPDDDVREALLNRAGRVGTLLTLCESLENADFEGVERMAKELRIPMQTILKSQGDAMVWVCKLSEQHSSAA